MKCDRIFHHCTLYVLINVRFYLRSPKLCRVATLQAEKDNAAMRVSSNLRPILSPNPALLSLLRYHHGTTSRDSRVAQISSQLLTHSAIRALGNQRAGWRLSPPMQCSTHASLASASILRRLLIGGEPLVSLVSREWMQELRAKKCFLSCVNQPCAGQPMP